MTDNVQCTRCGHRWYAEQFEDDILPDECPRCYRDAVEPIPPAPTIIDRAIKRITSCIQQLPEQRDHLQHRLILWKENHRQLIDLLTFATGMLVIITILFAFIFLWEG